MGRLLLLFVTLPVVELFLLIEVGQRIGTVMTIVLIVGTGIVGASLARQQGLSTLARLRKDLAEGRSPAEPLLDGALILVAAAVLVTPGVLTDLFGFLCLIPFFRRLLNRYLQIRFTNSLRSSTPGESAVRDSADFSGPRPIKNVTPPSPGRGPRPSHRP